jgi:hypothetical protein
MRSSFGWVAFTFTFLSNNLDVTQCSEPTISKPQGPIELQLMAFLFHVGFSGNAAGVHMISLDLEIALGTAEQYYQRCLTANTLGMMKLLCGQ